VTLACQEQLVPTAIITKQHMVDAGQWNGEPTYMWLCENVCIWV